MRATAGRSTGGPPAVVRMGRTGARTRGAAAGLTRQIGSGPISLISDERADEVGQRESRAMHVAVVVLERGQAAAADAAVDFLGGERSRVEARRGARQHP